MTEGIAYLDPSPPASVLPLPGLEPDSLLAFLALLGLLRSLQTTKPGWRPRVAWVGPPWVAHLHLAETVDESSIAKAASDGVAELASEFDVDGRANVDFANPDEFRKYLSQVAKSDVAVMLATALTAEVPGKRDGGLYAAPLVMMFGQGHQNFLERLVAVPAGEAPNRLKKRKPVPDMGDAGKVREALFDRWKRTDDADGFRWDPEEDQRYALRFDDPSGAGAALTVHGANRLASIGFLSFGCAPRNDQLGVPGVVRERAGLRFVWPLWTVPLSLRGIEALLSHTEILAGRIDAVRAYGVAEIMTARRISNGKFMNVTRAVPATPEQRRRAGHPTSGRGWGGKPSRWPLKKM